MLFDELLSIIARPAKNFNGRADYINPNSYYKIQSAIQIVILRM
jgi:hypothetical protein